MAYTASAACCRSLIECATLLALSCVVYYLATRPRSIEQVVNVVVLASSPPLPQVPPPPSASVLPESANSLSPPPPALTPSSSSPAPSTRDLAPAAANFSSNRWHVPEPPQGERSVPACVEANAWDDSHFSADQDYVLSTNGKRPGPGTLWRWAPAGGGGSGLGYLQHIDSGGHLNSRPGGFVRGHGNEERPPRRPAGRVDSAFLQLTDVDYARFQIGRSPVPCTWSNRRYVTLRFVKSRGAGFAHVLTDGSMHAEKQACSDDPACLFTLEPALGGGRGALVVRSVLTGGLLRMVTDHHPPFDGWNGVHRIKAHRKATKTVQGQRDAADAVLRGATQCPLTPRGRASAPRGWKYNTSAYAGLVRRSLAPWYDGGLSATAVDLAFFDAMYPYQNRHERPTLHISLAGGSILSKWQSAAPRGAEAAATPGPRGGPPAGSTDATFLWMLHEVHRLVDLPRVEFVAHTASLPKVPAQNLELVLAPATDEAHNDVPVPSPWIFAALRAAPSLARRGPECPRVTTDSSSATGHLGGPGTRPLLCVAATCQGSLDGFRGPLWPFYPPHRIALLASRPPLKGRVKVSLPRPCVGPPLENLPLEAAWDQEADRELRAQIDLSIWAPHNRTLAHAGACGCDWELLLDEAGPPKELIGALARGALVFRQWSPYVEFFHRLLVPWLHYIPVADSFADLHERLVWADHHPARVAEIRVAGQRVAAQLHAHEIACFWWQLLTALAPLEEFGPRDDQHANGFRRHTGDEPKGLTPL